MSGYLVEKEHIIYLLLAANSSSIHRCQGETMRWYHRGKSEELTDKNIVAVAKMLCTENLKSLKARYKDAELFGGAYEFTDQDFLARSVTIDPIQVIKACHCFAYQACEHKEWKTSEAKAFIDTLEYFAIQALPGYDKAIWGAPVIT